MITGIVFVTTVRDGTVYEWQGSSLARMPKSVFDNELLPAYERGALPWEIEVREIEWDTETVIVERIDVEEDAIC